MVDGAAKGFFANPQDRSRKPSPPGLATSGDFAVLLGEGGNYSMSQARYSLALQLSEREGEEEPGGWVLVVLVDAAKPTIHVRTNVR